MDGYTSGDFQEVMQRMVNQLVGSHFPGQVCPRINLGSVVGPSFLDHYHMRSHILPPLAPNANRRPTDDLQGLWRKILDCPYDDTPKLVYADALDDGRQYAPDESQAEAMLLHAEVIRLHCQHSAKCLHQWGVEHTVGFTSGRIQCQDRDEHKRLRKLYQREVKVVDSGTAAGSVRISPLFWIPLSQWCIQELPVTDLPYAYVVLQGGFPSAIALRLHDWYKDNGMRFVKAAPITNVRLTCRIPGAYTYREEESGRYIVTDDLEDGRIESAHPSGWQWQEYIYRSQRSFDQNPANTIPPKLWQRVEEYRLKSIAQRAIDSYDSYRWLSYACVAYARECAGLPAIDP